MENLRGIIRDAIELAKESGLWQRFTPREKKSIVEYFYSLQNTNKEVFTHVNTMD